MDRELRQLIHQKGSRVKVVNSHPMMSDGEDGDIYLYGLGVNGILYVKGFGKWWRFKSADVKGDGWHGSTNRVKLLPSEFKRFELATSSGDKEYITAAGIVARIGNENNGDGLVAMKSIPLGYKATGVMIHTNNAHNDMLVKVYQRNMSDTATPGVLNTLQTTNTYLPFVADVSTEDNFMLIHVGNMDEVLDPSTGDNLDMLYGGYIQISPTLTPELISEGATSEDGLARTAEGP